VLQVLSDPGHPDLPAKLRFAASSLTARNCCDLPRWIQGGLLTHLLNILRALQTINLGSAEAADICAAAAVTLCNMLILARSTKSELAGSTTPDSIAAQVACPDVLAAVVQYGMLGLAAQEPLPPGRDVPHIEITATYTPAARALAPTAQAARRSKQLWTPLRLCGFLIVEALSDHSQSGSAASQEVKAVVGQLAQERVFHHLLLTALEDPGGTTVWMAQHAALCAMIAP
jgi:hypothetical protein